MFLRLDLVLYILGYVFIYLFIVYITLFRFIVLYSRCRVNRGTNLSVVLYYVIFYCFHCAFGPPVWGVPNLWGASPLCCSPLRNSLTVKNNEKEHCEKCHIFAIRVSLIVQTYSRKKTSIRWFCSGLDHKLYC